MNNNIVMALTKKKSHYVEMNRKVQEEADRQIKKNLGNIIIRLSVSMLN